jgi:hypothetical protein
LAFTAAQMVVNETLLKPIFDGSMWHQDTARWSVHLVFMSLILGMSWLHRKRQVADHTSDNLEMTEPQTH